MVKERKEIKIFYSQFYKRKGNVILLILQQLAQFHL